MKASDWDDRYAASELLWSAEPNRFVREELEGLAPGRALDLACGEGRNAIWLAELGWTVDAVDYSTVAIQRAHARAADRDLGIAFAVEDVLSVSREDDSDLVLITYLQLPPDERAQVVRIARRALAPGATLLLVGHDRRNHADGTGGPKDSTLLWTVAEVVDALDGLEIERAAIVERPVEGSPRPALDTLVRARRPG